MTLRILILPLLFVVSEGLNDGHTSSETKVPQNEFEQAKKFLDDIQQLTFYRTSWTGKEEKTVCDPNSKIMHFRPNGTVRSECKDVPFGEVRNRLLSFVWSPQDVRETFSHGTFKEIPPFLVRKGSFPAVATMRDGSERILHVLVFMGSYTVEGMNLLFGFDETGRKKWHIIDQRYRDFLWAHEKAADEKEMEEIWEEMERVRTSDRHE